MPEAALDRRPHVGRSHLLRHDETDGRDVRRFIRSTHMNDEIGLNALSTTANRLAEDLAVAHAVHARQHGVR